MVSKNRARVLASRKNAPPALGKTPHMALPKPGAVPVHAEAALVVRFVRFMDDLYGPGNWEAYPDEDEDRVALRHGLFLAFKAGAGAED